MAALVSVLVLCIVNVLVHVLFTRVIMGMFMLIIVMATHMEFTSFLAID